MKIFAKRLKELRKERGMSLQKLSAIIGASANSISRWERCERLPNIENIVALANCFNVSADYLCGLTD